MDNLLKQKLKAKAHSLKPVVILGTKGCSDSVIKEINESLTAHELIKVKMTGIEKMVRKTTAHHLCKEVGAHLVQLIGQMAVIYRKNLGLN